MRFITPSQNRRLNEVAGFLFLSLGLLTLLSLASYHVQDPSFNTSTDARPINLIGYPGAFAADLFFQTFGIAAFLFPAMLFVLAWRWIRSEPIEAPLIKVFGTAMLLLSACALLSLGPTLYLFSGAVRVGGIVGLLLGTHLKASFNLAGSLVLTLTTMLVSIYLISTFTIAKLALWFAGPIAFLSRFGERWSEWADRRAARKAERARIKAEEREEKEEKRSRRRIANPLPRPQAAVAEMPEPVVPAAPPLPVVEATYDNTPPFDMDEPQPAPESEEPRTAEIPICALEEQPEPPASAEPEQLRPVLLPAAARKPKFTAFRLPSTELLNEPPARNPYDEAELKDIASRIKAKFEEFNVLGNVVQINPGPVVTTFEFKPEAGIKYSRITNLSEDLCLGLQAESILIERIPGKPTVGIEVPNSKRELISLRQMIECDDFQAAASHLAIVLGKDINGRMKIAALETMPHLLIAGSTGSGKSVMINSMVMSLLYKATPDEVRMIMVDPKRVELGIYEGIPHLLTPVITEPKKATNALKNAVLEMERRLRLLAEHGVRNIDQFNKKIRKLQEEPRSLFEEKKEETREDLRPLPYILILIDELADLMMLEGRNVEESVTRLAQMARAVGIHLVLATQRPSVDVITGLIKANFPARISFRVATRVDSRTVLDVMGAEHLLGKGDMLFLPPGSSRLTRVHGAFVTENEINRVVDFWKEQATPEYDQSYLIAPPSDEGDVEVEEVSGEQDPMYEEAVRIVLEMGKASTSTLQRRLRLGYGRAARILDMMQRDGLIGPPDGSKPREVLKRPDWLKEVEDTLR